MDPPAVFHPGQQRPHVQTQPWVLPVRRHLAQRDEHEPAPVQLRVGKDQIGSFQDHIIEEENVQVDDPVGPAHRGGPASHLPFDPLTVLQEVLRSQARFDPEDAVHVPLRRRAPRLGGVQGRDLPHPGLREPTDLPCGAAAVFLFLPLVRPDPDVGAMRHGR